MQIEIDILKRVPLRNLNPEVGFRLMAAFLNIDMTSTPPPIVGLLQINFINSGAVDIIRTAYYIRGLELMKLSFRCVVNDGPYTLL